MKKPAKYLEFTDDVVQILLAVLLLVAAVTILGIAAFQFAQDVGANHFQAVIELIHELLLVMILLELMSTVITYLKEHIIPLSPFIIIGIISSLRKLLTIGAEMTISDFGKDISEKAFNHYLTELALHTGIVFLLVISLWFVMKYKIMSTIQASTSTQRRYNKNYNKQQQQKK